jgi:5'-nucleotidase
LTRPSLGSRLILATILGVGLGLAPFTAPVAHAADAVTINLLNFNDFHGRIAKDLTVQFAGTIEKSRAEYGEDHTLLLSGGDNIGASLFASATQADQPTIDVLNALGVKASAVGNHEFDKGFADLTDRVIGAGAVRNAAWDYLGANVYKTGTTTPVLPEYQVYTVAGVTVGVIGVVTQETPSLVSSIGIKGLTFGDPVAAVNRVAEQLSDGNPANGEAQVLVAEYHEGSPLSSSASVDLPAAVAAGGAFKSIVEDTSAKVDVIFNAHTHQTYAWSAPVTGGTRAVVQAGSYASHIGQVVLSVDPATGNVVDHDQALIARSTDTAASLVAAYPRAATVNELTNAALDHATTVGEVKVGKVTADVTTAFRNGTYTNGRYTAAVADRDDRAKESTLGNLVADALLKTLKSKDHGGAQIGVVNPGGLRAELYYAASGSEKKPGIITRAEANSVLPFVNNLWTTTLTGAQLKSVLEEQWQPDGSSRPYLQLGLSNNVRYTFDPDADRGSHITGLWVNGKAVKATDSFRIGSFSFLLAGGDNFTTFAQGTDTKDSGLVDYEAWIDYLKAKSPVSPSFVKHGVAVKAAPTAKLGQSYRIAVSGLDLTSLGAPANSWLKVTVGGKTVARNVPVTDGAATVRVKLPNRGAVVITAYPSKTVVRVPVSIGKGTVTVIDKDEARTVKRGKAVAFRVRTAALGDGYWPTGTVKVYIGTRVVAKVTLRAGDHGTKKITLTKGDLRRYGKGTVVATAKLVSSSNSEPTDLKVLTLTIV